MAQHKHRLALIYTIPSLLFLTKFKSASLGVQVLISRIPLAQYAEALSEEGKPLNSPLHCVIGDDERRSKIEDLMAEPAPSVEDCSVERTGERKLSVSAQSVMQNASLRLRTYFITISQLLFSLQHHL
jgi:hypothetical protein